MLPFNLSFKRQFRRKLDHILLEHFENASAFYYQLYLDKQMEPRKRNFRLKQCNSLIEGLAKYNASNLEKLKIKDIYRYYVTTKQYSLKDGGIIQFPNFISMVSYRIRVINYYWKKMSNVKLFHKK